MRLHHGHSAALGFVLALALQKHALTFALLIFGGGVLLGRGWLFWKHSASLVGEWVRSHVRA